MSALNPNCSDNSTALSPAPTSETVDRSEMSDQVTSDIPQVTGRKKGRKRTSNRIQPTECFLSRCAPPTGAQKKQRKVHKGRSGSKKKSHPIAQVAVSTSNTYDTLSLDDVRDSDVPMDHTDDECAPQADVNESKLPPDNSGEEQQQPAVQWVE